MERQASIGAILLGIFIVGCESNINAFPEAAPGAMGGAGGTSGVVTGGSANGGASSAAGSGGQTMSSGGTAGGAALPPCEPTAASIRDTIITPLCSSRLCHGSGMPAATLDLGSTDWATNLVGVSSSTCDGWARVVPGSPEQSFLFEKLTKTKPACDGDQMPGGDALPAEYVKCIADWITGLSASGCETCGGSACVSLPSDSSNCGACGTVCPAGSSCQSGSCVCPSGQSACGAACVDEAVDPDNCGACGHACAAGAACNGGQCACSGSLTACGSGCFDVVSDAAHCGSCDNACTAGQVCLDGSCASGCGSLTQCGASCVDLETSATSCGSCGNACPTGLSCSGGTCGCPAGQMLCGVSCVEVASDAANCGACGVACGPGSTCSAGACQCGSAAVSFQNDVQPVFTSACTNAGCHSGNKPKEGLSLEAGKAYAALVGVKAGQCGSGELLVKPGDAGGSYLMNKLLGTNLCSGSQMPKAGQSVPANQLAAISDWICQGAKSN